jgi:hypothetical protein
MNEPFLRDAGDHWTVDMTGLPVSNFDTEWTLALGTEDERGQSLIRIGDRFDLSIEGTTVEIDPDRGPASMGQTQPLQGMTFSSVTARKDGQLDIAFREGATIHVSPSEEYETWELWGPQGCGLVCLPGGDVAVWLPKDSG